MRRRMNDGPGNAETLLHAAGQCFDKRSGFGFQADQGNHIADARRDEGGIEFVGAGKVIDVFPDFEVAIDGEKIGEVADVPLSFVGLAFDVNFIDGDLAGGGREEAADHFEGSGFAGTVRADEAEDFAGRNFEGEVVGGDKKVGLSAGLVVLLGDVVQTDHVCHPECAVGALRVRHRKVESPSSCRDRATIPYG